MDRPLHSSTAETQSILLELCNCADATREQAFNDWYTNQRLPDMLSIGVFQSATRFVNTDWQPGHPKYLAIYGMDREDVGADHRALTTLSEGIRKAGSGLLHEVYKQWFLARFRRMRQPVTLGNVAPVKTTKSLLVALRDCTDPAREDEYNDWYFREHAPDTLSSGVYFRATRYINIDWKPGDPKYLQIYESDWDDANAAREAMGKANAALRKIGRAHPHPASRSWFLGKFRKLT